MADSKTELEAAVAALRARFAARIAATPALSDRAPLGEGPPNRHGMPRVPPGQTVAKPGKWPVLDLGEQPEIAPDAWRLRVDGAVEAPLTLSFADLMNLPQVDQQADFHCVTGFSLLDLRWAGVRLETVLALARPVEAATHLMLHGADGYETNLPLEEALKPDVLLVHAVEGKPLPPEHGGPVRAITPQLYAWKGAKWVTRLEVLTRDRRGYWEIRGYSNTAHPWREDRMW